MIQAFVFDDEQQNLQQQPNPEQDNQDENAEINLRGIDRLHLQGFSE